MYINTKLNKIVSNDKFNNYNFLICVYPSLLNKIFPVDFKNHFFQNLFRFSTIAIVESVIGADGLFVLVGSMAIVATLL